MPLGGPDVFFPGVFHRQFPPDISKVLLLIVRHSTFDS